MRGKGGTSSEIIYESGNDNELNKGREMSRQKAFYNIVTQRYVPDVK